MEFRRLPETLVASNFLKRIFIGIFWGCLLLTVWWNAVVSVGWKMVLLLLVVWVGKCCRELGN